MTETSTKPTAPAGATPALNATPAGAFAYFTGPSGAIAWLDLPASYDEPPVGFLRLTADDPESTYTFEVNKAWAAEVDRLGLTETPVPSNDDPAAESLPDSDENGDDDERVSTD